MGTELPERTAAAGRHFQSLSRATAAGEKHPRRRYTSEPFFVLPVEHLLAGSGDTGPRARAKQTAVQNSP